MSEFKTMETITISGRNKGRIFITGTPSGNEYDFWNCRFIHGSKEEKVTNWRKRIQEKMR